MAFSGNATNNSGITGSAAGSVLDPVNLVNVPVATPINPRLPGAVDSQQYLDPGTQKNAASIDSQSPNPIESGEYLQVITEGGYQDASWVTGTDNPNQQPWDSNAGLPFSGVAGGVNPDAHDDEGFGATFAAQYVVPAAIGSLVRHTSHGQTYNREYVFDPTTGMNVPAANGRTDLDQQQWHDPEPLTGGGYAPWDRPYAERPIMNNLAYEAMPILPTSSQYTPSGQLPDRSQYNAYTAEAYDAPADPYVGTVSPEPAGSGNGLDFGLVI